MSSDDLTVTLKTDQEQLLERLDALEAGKATGELRDQFLDEWVAYSTTVGLVLYDGARQHLEEGQALVDRMRKEGEESGFDKKFAELESADDDAVPAVARETSPVFRAETDRVLRQLVLPLVRELDDDVLAELVRAYRQQRPVR